MSISVLKFCTPARRFLRKLPAYGSRLLFFWPLFFIFIPFLNCNTPSRLQHSTKQPGEKLDLNKTGNDLDKIAFLEFEVTLIDSLNDKYEFRLKKTTFATGLLKPGIDSNDITSDPNYLYCQVSDENQKALSYQKVQNPLKTIYEYPGENGTLGKKNN